MITVKCIARIRGKRDEITGYKIQDFAYNCMVVTAEALKRAVRDKKVEIVNLTLTSDNRFVEKKNYDERSMQPVGDMGGLNL